MTRPARGQPGDRRQPPAPVPAPWAPFAAEMVGTLLLVAVGLSIVILDFGRGSPVPGWIPSPAERRLLTGFLFGATGGLIAISPIGKQSGAHINPVVTLAFMLAGTLRVRVGLGYVLAQLCGAVLGALALPAWGAVGRSVAYGATVPGPWGDGWALGGEVIATGAMVMLLFLFLGHRRIRAFTPALFAPLYALMVLLEGPISGTSTNPARSLGPAIAAGEWRGWWIYWVGPILGATLSIALLRHPWLRRAEVEVAKLYHFAHDPHGLLQRRRAAPGSP